MNTDNNISVCTEVSLDMLAEVLCSALEGGTSYWAQIDLDKSRLPSDMSMVPNGWERYKHIACCFGDGSLTLIDVEGSREVVFSFDKIKDGLKTMIMHYPQHYVDMIKDNHDAITGDVFVQCCLFNDVIYG